MAVSSPKIEQVSIACANSCLLVYAMKLLRRTPHSEATAGIAQQQKAVRDVIPGHTWVGKKKRSRSSVVIHLTPKLEIPGSDTELRTLGPTWHGTSATAGQPRFKPQSPHNDNGSLDLEDNGSLDLEDVQGLTSPDLNSYLG